MTIDFTMDPKLASPSHLREIGQAYFYGQGVEQDFSQGAKFFRLAADQGHPEAQFDLGQAFYKGLGVKQ
jgi:TPR repeat protein